MDEISDYSQRVESQDAHAVGAGFDIADHERRVENSTV